MDFPGMELPPGEADNAAMRLLGWTSLAFLLLCVGASGDGDRTGDDAAHDASFDEAIGDAFGGLPPPAGAWPPPPMFQCTDYDGEVRYSEEYAPSDRCVPLSVLGYRVQDHSPAAATCRWVRESCLRLDDARACEQFRDKLRKARSDALHAFSDTAAFRKSEAERLERIVDESCR